MAQTGTITTSKAVSLLRGETGLGAAIVTVAMNTDADLPKIPAGQVISQNVALEIAEKAGSAKYPAIYVYCDRVVNQLREKFRTFSGKSHMVMEVRVSQDRLEGLEAKLQLYVDAITQVLDGNRGDWGQGMFYTGGYEVTFQAVKHGGKNYLQVAKVGFEVDISSN